MTKNRDDRQKKGASLLARVNSSADLKALSMEDLQRLAAEIRERIISTAAAGGGHLAPHLGVVEMTLAIHYVFDTPHDLLVWDVGHQTYAHKLVTGRRDRFDTIRKKDGLSGYPRRSESPYDPFGVGHSSTSISAALGMSVSADLQKDDRRVIAVIGDGAMTAGMAFEALAHAGHLGKDLLVVLNDNRMSISPNVGALSSYFNRLITHGLYNRAKEDVESFMKRIVGSHLTRAAQRVEQSVKGFITAGGLFEEFGFRYIGPVDGHDLPTLVDFLRNIKNLRGPILFHCFTQKGKGYSYAEEDPCTYHGVRPFNVATGQFEPAPSSGKPVKSFTDVFADALIEAAKEDDRIVGITAAMPTGTGLSKFQQHFPDRFFDVGICEQHAVTFAAGLATQGMRPVAAIYSTFLQRAYDQYLHDVCLQNLPVVFAIDRAGAVGEDSPTQQGAFDLSFLRSVPNIQVLAPRDDVDMRLMLQWALQQDGPVAVRYARASAPTLGESEGRDITRGEILREGSDAILLGLGPCLAHCLEAADLLQSEGRSVGVIDARWVKPLDAELLDRIAGIPIVTVEENSIVGGFGSAVLEHFESRGRLHELRLRRLGFPDAFIDHATREQQLAEIGLDPHSIAAAVRSLIEQHSPVSVK